MLIGVPGSGKSFWTERHVAKAKRPYTILSSDAVLLEWAAPHGFSYAKARDYFDIRTVLDEVHKRYDAALGRGDDLIFDQTNMTVGHRAEWLAKLPPSYHKTAVIFVVSDPVLKARLKEREQRTGKVVPWEVVERMARQYANSGAPTRDEFDKIIRVRV
jgi:predicted kinase